jgi:hypothetical protein
MELMSEPTKLARAACSHFEVFHRLLSLLLLLLLLRSSSSSSSSSSSPLLINIRWVLFPGEITAAADAPRLCVAPAHCLVPAPTSRSRNSPVPWYTPVPLAWLARWLLRRACSSCVHRPLSQVEVWVYAATSSGRMSGSSRRMQPTR